MCPSRIVVIPALSTTGKILVTGALNGFLTAWIVRTLLNRGHYVVGTVRKACTGNAPEQQFLKKEGEKASQFEYIVIPGLPVVSDPILS